MNSGRPSYQELICAIHKKCMDCCGGMRKEVHRCRLVECPIWPYRRAESKEAFGKTKGQISIFDTLEACGTRSRKEV